MVGMMYGGGGVWGMMYGGVMYGRDDVWWG